ncbi:glutamate mutase L [Deltaproteobacteria bacterium OttesenSCG-928-M10]|nr:glutamate mutase L [Deltaproteobacteria bacterium OttesenSCG-928-M10]
MPDSFLIYDVGSTYTKVSAFRREGRGLEFSGRAQHPTTLDDIARGLEYGRAQLLPEVIAAVREAVSLASSSAAGGLRMVAMGYMPKVTAKAAKEVAMNAGARVLEVVSHDEPPEYRLEVLREIRPDIILLAGGTDGGESESLLENARLIARAKLPAKVILAGNTAAQPAAARAFDEAGVPYARVGNVMPTIHDLNVRPARAAIHREFIKQITKAPGLAKLAEVVADHEVIPTPAAILMGAELLAGGTYNRDGAGGVLVLDIGGATTDVHSAMPELGELKPEERGLVINNDKQVTFRTVEGNLGLRVSAAGIVDAVGPEAVLNFRDRLKDSASGRFNEEECDRLINYARFLENNTGHLPADEWERDLEPALAVCALTTALRRHAGYWVTEFNPVLGLAPGSPVGRDLRGIKWVVGVGGFFSHNSPETGFKVLRMAFDSPGYSLFPENPVFRLDQDYLLYAVGLLGRHCPDQALDFALKYFNME